MKSSQPYVSLFFTFVILLSASAVFAQKSDRYQVVVNHEEQYSIWPANKKISKHWKSTEIKGNLATCQNYIENVWTDMRPLSIQKMNLAKDTEYQVVINHEEQYSILPKNQRLPKGWKTTNIEGQQLKCQQYIGQVWTDMRPLSIQKRVKRKKSAKG